MSNSKEIGVKSILYYCSIVGLLFNCQVHSQPVFEEYFDKALQFEQEGKVNETLKYAKKAYNINPFAQGSAAQVGLFSLLNAEYDSSIIYLNKAIELDPTDFDAHYNLACTYSILNQINRAVSHLESALEYGFLDLNHIVRDNDLENIRNSTEYKTKIAKHFNKMDLEISALYAEALTKYHNDEFKYSKKLFNKLIRKELKKTSPNIGRLGIFYSYLAFISRDLSNKSASISYMEKSIEYLSKIDSKFQLASNYRLLGLYHSVLKANYQSAAECWKNSLNIYSALKDSFSVYENANSLGALYLYDYPDNKLSAYYSQLAFEYGKRYINDAELKELIMQNFMCQLAINNIDNALFWSEFGLSLTSVDNMDDFTADMYIGTGALLAIVNPTKAIPYLESFLHYAETNTTRPDSEFDRLVANFYLIISYTSLGLHQHRIDAIENAIQIINQNKIEEHLAYYFMGLSSTFNKDYRSAIAYHKKNLSCENSSDSWCVLLRYFSMCELVGLELVSRNINKAENYIEEIIEFSEQNNDYLKFSLLMAAGFYAQIDKPEYSLKYLLQLYNAIEDSRIILSDKYQNEIFDNLLPAYEFLAMYLIAEDDIENAFYVLESAQSRSLKFAIDSNFNLDEINLKLGLNELYYNVNEINSSTHSLYKAGAGIEIGDIYNIEDEYQNLIYQFTLNYDSSYTYNVIITDSIFRAHQFGDLEVISKAFVNNILFSDFKSDEYEPSIENSIIYELIINNTITHLNKDNFRIILSPDSKLSLVPIEAVMLENGKYLIEKVNISYIQSASMLSVIREQAGEINTNPKILAIGAPNYEQSDYHSINEDNIKLIAELRSGVNRINYTDLIGTLGYSSWPDLPWAMEEIAEIEKLFPGVSAFTGSAANESSFKSMSESSELLKFDIIHFATHGLVLPGLSDYSSIVLSTERANKNEDGFITVEEISKLKLDADLVVLSACETAQGDVYAGEGVVGFTHAFFIAGANAVIASLWPVDDRSTAIFMKTMYGKIADGSEPWNALAETKREFIAGNFGEQYKHPYYWAPFIYYGK